MVLSEQESDIITKNNMMMEILQTEMVYHLPVSMKRQHVQQDLSFLQMHDLIHFLLQEHGLQRHGQRLHSLILATQALKLTQQVQ